VTAAVWLSDSLVVMLGSFPGAGGSGPDGGQLVAMVSGSPFPLEVRLLPDERLPERLLPGGGALAVCRLPSDEVAGDVAERRVNGRRPEIGIRLGAGPAVIEAAELQSATSDLRTFVRDHLAGLRADTRAGVVEFLVSACGPDLERTGGFWLSRKLLTVREALRERLPYCVIRQDEPQGIYLDRLLAIDEHSFWTKGWVRDLDATGTRITAVSPEGARAEVLSGAFRHTRADIVRFYEDERAEKHGFINFFRIQAPSRLAAGWVAELRNELGVAVETDCPPAVRDPVSVRESILLDLAEEEGASERLLADHAYPALTRLQERLRADLEIEAEIRFGQAPDAPEVSVVVPLYKRIDLLEHQLAAFARDPELREAELIFVLDSPELDAPLSGSAAELFKLYGVPFRVVTLNRNAGFSNATNAGVSLASGRLLLLLNSDVLPEHAGWLSRMVSFYDSTPGIGALGPKLLYEDDSIQHAGVFFSDISLSWEGVQFYRETGSPLWENAHYFKGLHRDLSAANVARPVPAVTAACMMIDKALYDEIGGLSDIYVQGGYEDTDVCLRLMEAGRENWYLPAVELYHLEDQSYPTTVRTLATKYNMWLHTHLWNERIQEVMREQQAAWGPAAAS
jgi:O-antigen biosynthesis protein